MMGSGLGAAVISKNYSACLEQQQTTTSFCLGCLGLRVVRSWSREQATTRARRGRGPGEGAPCEAAGGGPVVAEETSASCCRKLIGTRICKFNGHLLV